VFAEFDGRSWRPRRTPALAAPTVEFGGETVSQQIDLVPHHSRRLFALDRPVSVSVPATIFADHTIQTPDNIDERLRYSAVSTTALAADPLQPWAQRIFLALPPDDNPEARKLAAGWRTKARQPSEIIETALSYFRSQGFVYSITPPLLGEHPVDDFLLGSRKGFCEHYASAFAFLMRAAGVPSRIVAGYLGGEQNPFGGYLIVRQFDAHAWVEVWLEDNGWTRIDPTAVVAPERAEGGAEAALPPSERIAGPPFSHLPVIGEAARRIVLGWDAVNTFWDRRVLGYTAETQRRLLARLGISGLSRRWTAAVFAAGMLLMTAVLVAAVLRPAPVRRRRSDPVQDAYLKLCTRLERLGIPRRPDQGPLDYLKTIEQKRPELRPALGPVFEAYIHFRYGGRRGDADRSRFLKSVRRLSLKKRPGRTKK
jgi:transglutaminase-like putative cysteine protease